MKLVLVIPCYNEEAGLSHVICTLVAYMQELMRKHLIDKSSRCLFVDDGSTDSSWSIIFQASHDKEIVSGIRYARNEGHQSALWGGYTYAYRMGADAVISIDADLQQDINAIPDFLEKYKSGSDIVFGIRNSRDTDGFLKKCTAGIFYKGMSLLGTDTIKNHADYRLISRRALEALLEYGETQLFLRGMVRALGFRQDVVYFDVKPRMEGESKYTLRKMFALAADGVTSFSIRPMHLIFGTGIFLLLMSAVVIIYNIAMWLKGVTVPGWASVLCSIWFLGGMNFVFLGIIGEYIAKCYMETKKRPVFQVWEEVNIDG